MKNIQPNFEILKTAFYQAFLNSDKANYIIALQAAKGDFRTWNTKAVEFKSDFNKWLNGLDIRQSGVLIDILKEHKKPIVGWMANKQYYIDYNHNNALDIIRIEND